GAGEAFVVQVCGGPAGLVDVFGRLDRIRDGGPPWVEPDVLGGGDAGAEEVHHVAGGPRSGGLFDDVDLPAGQTELAGGDQAGDPGPDDDGAHRVLLRTAVIRPIVLPDRAQRYAAASGERGAFPQPVVGAVVVDQRIAGRGPREDLEHLGDDDAGGADVQALGHP